MTENEARLILDVRISRFDHADDVNIALEIAKNAIDEIQKYRNLGTIEFLTDMKSNYVEVLSDLRQYQKIGTVEECQQNKAIAEELIHKEHLVTIQDTSVPTTLNYMEDRCWYGPDTWQCGDITR